MRILLAGALAAALATGGCGSDGDGADLAGRDSATTTVAVGETTTSALVQETTTTAAAPGAPGTTAARRPSAAPTTARPAASPTTTAAPAPAPATTAAPPAAAPPDLTIQNFTFNPAVLNVARGKKVTVKNLDSAQHTWTADDGSWSSGTLAKDQTFSHTFNAPGTFAYRCNFHPSMKGTVNVQ